jgi:ketosteroid isomerase-like protein
VADASTFLSPLARGRAMLPRTMTTSDLDAFFEQGWNRHDVDRLMAFMAEECVFESASGPEACGGRHVGREAVRRAFAEGCDLFTFAGDKIARESSFLKTRAG